MKNALVAALLALSILGSRPAAAQAPTSGCNDGGLIYDDATLEGTAGWDHTVTRGEFVMRVDPPASPATLETLCICWRRFDVVNQVFFNIRIYDADGPGGGPGTLLGSVPAVASTVNSAGKFFRYDLSALDIAVDGPFYVGPEWDASDAQGMNVCVDQTGPGRQPAYSRNSTLGAAPFRPLGQADHYPDYKALGIRARFNTSAATCTSSPTTLCLNQGRFRVEATYQTPDGQFGAAKVVKLTEDTGYLWFFQDTNVEAVVKVLNGCGVNERFWVFAGGLTNVRTVITVTDTATGAVETYINPQDTAFQPIQDTDAFGCQ